MNKPFAVDRTEGTRLEYGLSKAIVWSGAIVVLVFPLFLIYLVGVSFAVKSGLLDPPYPVLSLHGDPVFDILVAVLAVALFVFSSALFVLTALPPDTSNNREIILPLSGIAIGSSAAAGYHTVPRAIQFIGKAV